MSGIEDLKTQYELAKEVIGDVRKTIEGINSPRSVVLEVFNATKFTLKQVDSHHDHGDFAITPDAVIEPQKFNIFGSKSASNSLFTGTEGFVTYGGDGGFSLKVYWDNPFAGSNSCGAETSGNDGFIRAISSSGGGNQDAEMRFSLLQYDFPIIGAIRSKYIELGWESSPLGLPLTAEAATFDNIGRWQNFQGGLISWRPETGAHAVWGLTGERWLQLGREQFGYPITDETPTPDGHGRFYHFRAFKPDGSVIGDSSIYWTPETGAHEIYGAIRVKWASMGWEKSPLGYPVDHEQPTFDGVGRRQSFQGGVISWYPTTGAFAVWGLAGMRWLNIGSEQFGYPITDETPTPDGHGRFYHFRAFKPDGSVIGDSSIYWTPETGAHEIYGAIRVKWASMGWEKSPLGYPTSSEQDYSGGRIQRFQNGSLFWTPQGGVVVQ